MSTRPRLTREIIHAVAQDAGNRSMRRAGRTAWSDEDWHEAYAMQQHLYEIRRDETEEAKALEASRQGNR